MAVTLLKRWLSWPNRPISFPLAVWSLISLFLSCTVTCSLTLTHSHTTKKLCLTNQKWNSNQFNTGQIAQKACVYMCALCARGQGVCLCEVRTNRYASLHRVEKANGYLLGANEKDRGYVSVRSVIFQAVSNIWLWHLLFSFSFRIRLEFPCSVKELVHCDGSARREPEAFLWPAMPRKHTNTRA